MIKQVTNDNYNLQYTWVGSEGKESCNRTIIQKERVDFICIQETKMVSVEYRVCQFLWGGDEVGWAFKESVGSSGGLLCLCNKSIFLDEATVSGNGFLGVRCLRGEEKI